MRVLVLGAGRMGAHHARMLARQDDVVELLICDRHPERSASLAREVGATQLLRSDAVAGVSSVDWVVVATPTEHHGEALAWAEAGAHVLVEKPLAADLDRARALRHPRIRVGHVERHNPVRAQVPLRGAVTVATRRVVARAPSNAPGRDVVSDLMLHDLDLLLSHGGGTLEVERVRGDPLRHVEAWVRGPLVTARLEAGLAPATPARSWEGSDAEGGFRLDFAGKQAWRNGALVEGKGSDALDAQWRTLQEGGGVGAEEALRALELAATILSRLPDDHETPERNDAS